MKILMLISLLTVSSISANAQDPVKLAPQYYKVLVDNDQARVLEFRLKPGEKEPMHSHPAGFVYFFGEGKIKITYPDGRTEESAITPGETFWRKPVTHAGENTGNTEIHAIALELKKPCDQ